MHVEVRFVGLPATGAAQRATDPVAQQTSPPLTVTLDPNARVDDLIQRSAELGASVGDIQEVLLNGDSVSRTTPLHDGDAVTLVGPVSSP